MSRARTFRHIQALKRGGERSGRQARGPLRTVVSVEYDLRTDQQRLVLDCGHVTRSPKGPFGAERDIKRVGDRRQCVECRRSAPLNG